MVIDDYLPVATHLNSQGKEVYRPLCSCSSDPTEYWISLVEKAYMKLNGGKLNRVELNPIFSRELVCPCVYILIRGELSLESNGGCRLCVMVLV